MRIPALLSTGLFPAVIPATRTLTGCLRARKASSMLAKDRPLVSFAGANLRGVDGSGAPLQGVDLRGAYLYEANLSEANLSGAYLSGVLGTTNAELEQQAPTLSGARMPNGLDVRGLAQEQGQRS